jgi:uncharacterized membrane protein
VGRRTEYFQPDVLDATVIAAIATCCQRWHGHVVIPTVRTLTNSEIREINKAVEPYNVLASIDPRSPSGLAVLFIEKQGTFLGTMGRRNA